VRADDGLGGPPGATGPDGSAELRIATLAWRVRLAGGTFTVVVLLMGTSVALLFVASLGLAILILAGGSALARLELRVHTIRQERRR
jgi:hypothetical protein